MGMRRFSRTTTLYRSLLSTPPPLHHHTPLRFYSATDAIDSSPPSPSPEQTERIHFSDRPLQNNLDHGIYKAILVGKAGQKPLQKKLKTGTVLTLFSIGTGGIRYNLRPLDHEKPGDYVNRSAVQWHRVTVYNERLGNLLMKHVFGGSTLYVEGNLETKVFTEPVSGLVRRIREVSVRRNGRVILISQGDDAEQQAQENDLRAVGYY